MERRAIEVRGIVQGVGFRPYVHGLATRLGLNGFVRNCAGAMLIEIEGEAVSIERFCDELQHHPPPLARIEALGWTSRAPRGEQRFAIEPSQTAEAGQIFISPDVAVCRDCLAELFDPRDRRYRYPFINCTNCGPRLTIVTGAPYDRRQTTMSAFALCDACRAEYADPANRRFHAQPIACPACGPRLTLRDSAGAAIDVSDPIAAFVELLRCGKIGALKGLGGYHLACCARREIAVAELRRRKHRDEKPFAVMLRDVAAAESLCVVTPEEKALLESPQAPIVLLRRRHDLGAVDIAAAVAPGNPYLGVMLPYTPLHHLLLEAMKEAPLVMTSGNRSDEPIAYRDEDALDRLAGIADAFLTHNRPIHVRCDDSVTRIVGRTESPLRRARGYAPEPVRLPHPCPRPILAVGGQLKGAFALGRDSQAFVSQHLGDLDHLEAYRAFERDLALYQELFSVEPALIAHDLHPDYASTRFAASRGLPLVSIQHHHAHLASCMAEHGLNGPVIGVTFDGAGLGTDGAIWGGEFLVGDYAQFHRNAHLRYVSMPGGEQATRDPWRMAASHLLDAACDLSLLQNVVSAAALRTVRMMLERRINAPLTSSMGRLFDAVAAIAGVRTHVAYEAQAAMELEWLATDAPTSGVYSWSVVESNEAMNGRIGSKPAPSWEIDTRPLIREVAADAERGSPAHVIARRFHSTLVEMILDVCGHIRKQMGLSRVVLSGGVFMNALLTREAESRLAEEGFAIYRHRRVPTNDGGLCLGQLAVAAAREANP